MAPDWEVSVCVGVSAFQALFNKGGAELSHEAMSGRQLTHEPIFVAVILHAVSCLVFFPHVTGVWAATAAAVLAPRFWHFSAPPQLLHRHHAKPLPGNDNALFRWPVWQILWVGSVQLGAQNVDLQPISGWFDPSVEKQGALIHARVTFNFLVLCQCIGTVRDGHVLRQYH